ncbi:MAG: hypothetical protein C5S52_07830 [ANME-2 cluster archaeon]|nr:hypothetical protein [ANME-2 cluster archaeon]
MLSFKSVLSSMTTAPFSMASLIVSSIFIAVCGLIILM